MRRQQRYTPEFRSETVKLVVELGSQQSVAARRLSVPKRTLATWVAAVKSSSQPLVPGSRSATEVMAENAKLRKELAEARMERESATNGV